MSTYAWVDLGSLLFPLLFSFHPRIRFHRQWRWALPAIMVMMGLFIPWDALFTRCGIWGFTEAHVFSTRLMALPLEEWAFFICVPYACMFSYHCFQVFKAPTPPSSVVRWISSTLIVVLFMVVLLHLDRAYTVSACALCALWILFTAFVQRAPWAGLFYTTYLVMLVPFLIVNGILTGTGLDRPVVWYNDAENLGIRILTIPVEDVFYGMLMIGLTTSLYEAFRTRWPRN